PRLHFSSWPGLNFLPECLFRRVCHDITIGVGEMPLNFDAVTLAGPTCDSADVIARGYPMPTVGIGDVLISPVMGAYTSVT
ncbi:hypothetical protein C6A85_08915, partial [Mycobacterium sp. ITM-2017-0098]